MFFLLGIWNGLGEIRAHKLRSMLTITCVMLGVASLVLIAAFISGLFSQWEVYQQEMGWAQNVEVEQSSPPSNQEHLAAMSPGLTLNDAVAIERFSHHAAFVSAEAGFNVPVAYRGQSTSERVQVNGVTQGVLGVRRYEIARGRFINQGDIDRRTQVVVLGSSPARELFKGHEDPLGKTITLGGEPFLVVGLFRDYVSMSGEYNILERKNRVAYVPITSMQRRITGGNDQIDRLTIRAPDVSHLGPLVDEINSILTRTHRGIRDFEASTQQENVEEFDRMRRGFFLVGCGVGLITLLVGGIGIMNLMLASINERVREIGIRKAIGAWNRDIFVQFIAEAIALSTLGGAVGVGVGVAVVRMLRHAAQGGNAPVPKLSVPAVLVGLSFSVLVGVVAGLYPAVRASRLDPIEALRYE